MTPADLLLITMALDALLGEPDWLWSRIPHPAVLMGRLIGWADRRFNSGPARRVRGVVLIFLLVGGAILLGGAIAALPGGTVLSVLLAAILLAQRSLVDHVRAVARGLRVSLAQGRYHVSMIVGRDTQDMKADDVARAAMESAAENLSDGVVAPAFWFLVGGLPGLLAYKVVNTADSMIGYLTPRHAEFGWAAARLDDLLNWLPARLTAGLIALAGGRLRDWRAIGTEARLHRSPNAGWPEAALARVLDVALAGPRSYQGELRAFPFVHPTGNRHPDASSIETAAALLWKTWALGALLVTALSFVWPA